MYKYKLVTMKMLTYSFGSIKRDKNWAKVEATGYWFSIDRYKLFYFLWIWSEIPNGLAISANRLAWQ